MNLKQQIAEILKASNYYGIPGDTLAESISKLESLIESEAVSFVEFLRDYTPIGEVWVALSVGVLTHGSELHYQNLIKEHGKTTAELYKLKSKQKYGI